jgi:asparagine synthase (glutamine-hydrolysing)
MCGIAGEIRFDSSQASTSRVRRMMDAQERRGPDSQGLADFGRVVFGHRRLKIVDLSDKAAQPMRDERFGRSIVFNGCIYNHDALRQQLEALGHEFFSLSDTEVILRAYGEWGKACVDRLNGMFAFAIHDPATGDVFMARDRLGIKPLYFLEKPGSLCFASSLTALTRACDSELSVDPVALHHYMTFHSVVPAPRTILKEVRKLPPATRLIIRPNGERHEEAYWSPQFRRLNGDDSVGFDEWRERVGAALDKAVRLRTTGDVPVGALLSGGLDSSLIVAFLARRIPDSLQTFSVGFENRGDELGNEFEYSDIVAQEFGTRHHKIQVDSAELLEHLPDCLYAMSEPMVSHDNIAFYLLGREVSKHVKVVQSGQGADEVFGGYHWYPPMMDSKDPLAEYQRVFFDRDHDEFCRAVAPAYANGDASSDFVARHFDAAAADWAIDKSLHLDTTVMLVDDPVKRVDNMTMAWGLEARVPFLDHELVELAARIPPGHKIDGGGKYVLKEMARKFIPDAVIDRPKGYFPVPELKYLSGRSLEFVKDTLANQAARDRGLFNAAYVDELMDDPREHMTPLRGSKLWQVAVLEAWLQRHVDGHAS